MKQYDNKCSNIWSSLFYICKWQSFPTMSEQISKALSHNPRCLQHLSKLSTSGTDWRMGEPSHWNTAGAPTQNGLWSLLRETLKTEQFLGSEALIMTRTMKFSVFSSLLEIAALKQNAWKKLKMRRITHMSSTVYRGNQQAEPFMYLHLCGFCLAYL